MNFVILLDPEEEGNTIIRNVRKYQPTKHRLSVDLNIHHTSCRSVKMRPTIASGRFTDMATLAGFVA
jgi:hypothetical protein